MMYMHGNPAQRECSTIKIYMEEIITRYMVHKKAPLQHGWRGAVG